MCLSSHFDKSLSVKKANEWVAKKLKPSRQSDFEHSGRVSQLHQLLKYPEERGLKHIYIPLQANRILWPWICSYFSRRGCRTLNKLK